jgi:hypothetical protein
LAEKLEPLKDVPSDVPIVDYVFILWMAEDTLTKLLEESVFSLTLRSSVQSARKLIDSIKVLTTNEDITENIKIQESYDIIQNYNTFKITFLAEFEILPSFFVASKGGYDIQLLLQGGEVLFPSNLGDKVPEALFDAKEAAKALAFELGTACGFHVFRTLEAVLRRYYEQVTNGAAAPKVRTIGVYIQALKTSEKADEKILSVLKQIANFHRNPLIHPVAALDIEEAIGTIGVVRSAIAQMIAVLPDAPQTTLIEMVGN